MASTRHQAFKDIRNSTLALDDAKEICQDLRKWDNVFSAHPWGKKRNYINCYISVHMLQLPAALDAFDSHGLRAQNDRLIDIPDMITVLTSLYEVSTISKTDQ